MMTRRNVRFRLLGVATDVDVLPDDAVIEDRGEYVVVRTPSNPTFFWGNFLCFRAAPKIGDRRAWEHAFVREFGAVGESDTVHRTLSWDEPDDESHDSGIAELRAAGYDIERSVVLVVEPEGLRAHARANERASRRVSIRSLDPAAGADEAAWAAVIGLQLQSRDAGHDEEEYRRFATERMADRRRRFSAGDGAWLVAELDGEVVGSCGVVVTQARARFQTVDVDARHRRQGIASRIVHEAGRMAIEQFGAEHLVIVADAGYHALPLYESLGFVALEHVTCACWWPGAARAAEHPTLGPLVPARG